MTLRRGRFPVCVYELGRRETGVSRAAVFNLWIVTSLEGGGQTTLSQVSPKTKGKCRYLYYDS